MNRKFLQSLRLTLAALDFLLINGTFLLCEFVFRTRLLIQKDISYMYFGFFLCISWLLIVVLLNLYQDKYVLSLERFTKVSFQAYLYLVILVMGSLSLLKMFAISSTFSGTVLMIAGLCLVVNRILYLVIYEYFRRRKWLMHKVLVIGYNERSQKLVSYLENHGINKRIIGYCDEVDQVSELSNYPILSGLDQVLHVCKENNVTEVYSTILPEQNPRIWNLVEEAYQNCIRVRIVPDLSLGNPARSMHMQFVHEIPVLSLRREPLDDLDNRIRKRIFDIVISTLVTIFILSWLVPIVALLIWLESPGPIFFRQLRSGKDNQPFQCLKFRSMFVNKDADELQATKNDRRVTRVGKFLRRTSLDEFPQFLNVLIGEMSIVGPRPHMLKHTDQYSKLIGHYMLRQFLKPGITGWAQVHGLRGETQTLGQMKDRVEYDIWYMEHWNLWLDLRIMVMTVVNTMAGEEVAY